MAQRRMFSKSITNSSQYLMMPASSQNLYFHLSMNADDDGFCEHFSIMRMTDSKPDDLKILQAKGFVEVFDEKVLVITDWKENNYLRADRYTPSKYLSIYKVELARLSSGIPKVVNCVTQVRVGEGRVGEGRVENTAKNTKKEQYTNEAFNAFWKAYPRSEDKHRASALWEKLVLDDELPQILEFIEKAKKTDRWKKGFAKHPSTFLNGRNWEDDLASYDSELNGAKSPPAHVYTGGKQANYYESKEKKI